MTVKRIMFEIKNNVLILETNLTNSDIKLIDASSGHYYVCDISSLTRWYALNVFKLF